jgi:hypothetical protein
MAASWSHAQRGDRGPALHLAICGLALPLDASLAAVVDAFSGMAAGIRVAVPRAAVRAVSYSPRAAGGRGCARLCLPALAARAVLDAAPRLPAFGMAGISVSLWMGPAERQLRAQQRATRPLVAGRADAAVTWRRPGVEERRTTRPGAATERMDEEDQGDTRGITLRPAAPAFHPPAAAAAPAAAAPRSAAPVVDARCMPVAPAAAAPACARAAAARPAPPTHRHTSPAPATAPPSPPSPASPPAPMRAEEAAEREYTVAAFVASRRVGRGTEYLVHWAGYHLVGEEAAFTWQQSAQLRQDLDRRTYQRMLQGLRQREAAQQQRQQHQRQRTARQQAAPPPQAPQQQAAQRQQAAPQAAAQQRQTAQRRPAT